MPGSKEYKAAWHRANRTRRLAEMAAYRAADTRKTQARNAAYREANKEKRKAADMAWRAANPSYKREWDVANSAKNVANVARRRAAQSRATPKWANEFFIAEAYDLAARRTKATGYKWHVDHIVPLRSKIVCGLHVEHNLRVIPASVNVLKNNRHWPDMPMPSVASSDRSSHDKGNKCLT